MLNKNHLPQIKAALSNVRESKRKALEGEQNLIDEEAGYHVISTAQVNLDLLYMQERYLEGLITRFEVEPSKLMKEGSTKTLRQEIATAFARAETRAQLDDAICIIKETHPSAYKSLQAVWEIEGLDDTNKMRRWLIDHLKAVKI